MIIPGTVGGCLAVCEIFGQHNLIKILDRFLKQSKIPVLLRP